jgi:hypothetical protein
LKEDDDDDDDDDVFTFTWARHIACMGQMKNADSILLRKSEGSRTLGRPRNRGEYNIRLDLTKIE